MKIGLACDHRGYNLKIKIINYLRKKNIDVVDYGADSAVISVDYPEFGITLGEAIQKKEIDLGIAICGSGIGISIACNKVKGVRCAHVSTIKETKMTRVDNDSNIIAISGDMLKYKALDIVDAFINTKTSDEERHIRRIMEISEYERIHMQ